MKLTWAHASPGRLVVYASKLAACAGMHPYCPQAELRDEYLHAAHGAAAVREGYLPPAEAAAAALAALPPDARAAAERAIASRPSESTEVVRAAAEAAAAPGMTPEAAEVVRAALFTSHGARSEDGVRAALGPGVRTDARFRVGAEPLATVPAGADGGRPTRVYVGGKHDGMDGGGGGQEGEGRVVEIKTRQRRFLGCPLYERVQLHAYMHVYGVRRGVLVESYLGERREHEVAFDDALWAEVVDAVGAFVAGLAQAPGDGAGAGGLAAAPCAAALAAAPCAAQ